MKPSTRQERQITFEVFRYNPQDPDSQPHIQKYVLPDTAHQTLYLALNRIREEQDPSLQFDFACRSAVCGSCAMMVNGRPVLACRTQTSDLPDTIRLHPLPVFELIGDLSVDTGSWFRTMALKVESWIHERAPFDPHAREERMEDELASTIYDSERCIECGCCVAGCGVALTRSDFAGPAGLNRMARFMLDPRDSRDDAQWFDVVASDEGVFGCIGLMACEDICPKELPLREVYAYLRRKMLLSKTPDLIKRMTTRRG